MKKYAILEISTKQKKICDTESINMWILADVANCFTDFSILRHHDVTAILYWTYEFRFEIRVSNLVCMLNFNS